jgi:hypothetical protein
VCNTAEMRLFLFLVSREWDKLKSKDQKKAYIKSLLTNTPSVSRTP